MFKIKWLIVGLVIFVVTSLTPALAAAQQSPGGSGLSISPTISEFTLSPGQSTQIAYIIQGAAKGDVQAVGVVNDFVSDGTTGSPKILTKPGDSSPNSIKSFVSGLETVVLKQNERKTINVTISIPKGTPPGAYYGVVRYKANPITASTSEPGKVALTASVGSIVLITVPGNLRQQVQVTGLHVYHGTKDGAFFFGKPEKIGVEIRNLGNGFAKPFGSVEVQNMYGKTVDTYQFNNPRQLGNVLPNSSRIFTHDFKNASQFGRYKITASVSYGDGSQVLTVQKTIWYVPAWLLIIILAVVAALLALSYRAYRRYAHDNKLVRRK